MSTTVYSNSYQECLRASLDLRSKGWMPGEDCHFRNEAGDAWVQGVLASMPKASKNADDTGSIFVSVHTNDDTLELCVSDNTVLLGPSPSTPPSGESKGGELVVLEGLGNEVDLDEIRARERTVLTHPEMSQHVVRSPLTTAEAVVICADSDKQFAKSLGQTCKEWIADGRGGELKPKPVFWLHRLACEVLGLTDCYDDPGKLANGGSSTSATSRGYRRRGRYGRRGGGSKPTTSKLPQGTFRSLLQKVQSCKNGKYEVVRGNFTFVFSVAGSRSKYKGGIMITNGEGYKSPANAWYGVVMNGDTFTHGKQGEPGTAAYSAVEAFCQEAAAW